ncbi:MAG TPA: carboxypeptidase-like regulatory domain-containing protein [Candidatus Acidoferrales bacterium]|nr:carboxypeptidase-like regulatory domain-containing protein [Candidatus Acidoferrales bacterium]
MSLGTEEMQSQNQPPQLEQVQGPLLALQNQSSSQSNAPQTAIIRGTVTDIRDTPVSGASVTLQGSDPSDVRSITTNENGQFEIRDVQPGRPYQLSIQAAGFSEWDSPFVSVNSGQSKTMDANLRIEGVQTTMTVTPESSDEIANEQIKTEEKQRFFGIIPNFYAVYDSAPAPLNAGLKFRLALRVAGDPLTITGVAMLAAIGQETGNPHYVQGAKGYGERFAANYANSLTEIMLDGAVLPSLLHQDPRYIYKGTGTTRGRVAHVFYSLVTTRGDNGSLQPNYSYLGGDLASAAISNLYYPRANRGGALVLQGFAVATGLHLAVRMLDEFVFRPAKGSVVD